MTDEQLSLDSSLAVPRPATKIVRVKAHPRTIALRGVEATAEFHAAAPVEQGRALRDEGMARTSRKLTAEERTRLREIVRQVADKLGEFTIEDVEPFLPVALVKRLDEFPNARGAMMQGAARANIIANTMRVTTSTNVASRSSKIAIWRKVQT